MNVGWGYSRRGCWEYLGLKRTRWQESEEKYMFHPSWNTARTSISTLKSLVNFCSRDFLFNKKFDDSMLAKRHILVGHFVRSDTGHVMQVIDITRHSRITQQLVPSTTILSFVCCSQFACKKKLLMTFGTTLVHYLSSWYVHLKKIFSCSYRMFKSLLYSVLRQLDSVPPFTFLVP